MMDEREILRRTARTFHLSIRFLPGAVRDDVALAYLLARATDTIADASAAPEAERASLLGALRASLGHDTIAVYDADRWARGHGTGAEKALLRSLPLLWGRIRTRGPAVRDLLQRLMDSVLEGQIFDLERFGPGASPLSGEELERYTYWVAGSVGEFWDDLCRSKMPRYASAPDETMRSRARHYGQALQLVNILRDRSADAASGRVYVSAEDAPRWTEQARNWLGEGAAYCQCLRRGRLRYAALLPALLGWRTLAVIGAHGPGVTAPAKLSRGEVRRWMFRAVPVCWSAAAVGLLARRASE